MFLIKLATRMDETSPLLDSYQSWKSSFGQEVTFAFIEPSHQSAWHVENSYRLIHMCPAIESGQSKLDNLLLAIIFHDCFYHKSTSGG